MNNKLLQKGATYGEYMERKYLKDCTRQNSTPIIKKAVRNFLVSQQPLILVSIYSIER